MPRYRIDCAYHGAAFSGWQRQPGQRTVQSVLELWLGRILGQPGGIDVTGAGRTDAGVHAELMVAHFDVDQPIDAVAVCHRLRAALPDDIVVKAIRPVDSDFHARYRAIGRTYEYRVQFTASPFGRDRWWFVPETIDVTVLEACAESVMGRHDFRGFCLAESQRSDNHCTVCESHWSQDGTRLIYRISADRFLHEMVRLIVGTMVDAARGRFDAERVAEIISSADVRLCGTAAPPHGLTLVSVSYPGDADSAGETG
ncbi:MAG TPA: tRNA pseudouridine(38-40) synthase TruA [candidate division Zixibacteria bacterium]|jgi:tRNA pseudouridine38-40 synthase